MVKQCRLVFLICFVFGGCTEEIAPNPEELGLKYYPLQVGDYWIYQVIETHYQNQFANQASDSINYFVRERVDTIFKDLTNKDTYKIIRSRRNKTSEIWGTDSVFVVNKSGSDVRVTQNNVRVVKFIFPVVEGKKWNAHIYTTQSGVNNSSDQKFYGFADKNAAFSINNITYPNTVKVIQTLNDNAIERQDAFEVYAYGLGRIYKQVIAFNYCSDPDRQNGCEVGKQFIITGVKRVEKLLEHGSVK
ncbi:hypothetical protein AHMF7605_05355 [Adhaeribacter arboris]|uniref:Lipoprotein n=1 Tax=Adhaeribacter arboris TaxID=2072846 RepID=A0A2T2YBX1_9BACT|nr:hypothetical protein [Adhaeribacter arboris]PSR52993.1 hypothetical protein AHMF7605_05355 [Adhaeribacter arboris]